MPGSSEEQTLGFLKQAGKVERADMLESVAAVRFKKLANLPAGGGILKQQRAHILAALERHK
jgi:hypothetical protein